MLQRYVPHAVEAAVLYARLPGDISGRVLSLTLRYFPAVVGNGRNTMRQLIRSDARAQLKSAVHGVDPSHCGIDSVDLERIPARGEVVRFDTVEGLMRAEELSIVEINGIGGEAIDCWDPRLAVSEVYRLLFLIGDRNRARGFSPMAAGDFVSSLFRKTQLIRRYPASA